MDMLSLMALKLSGNTMDVNIMDVITSKILPNSNYRLDRNGLKEKLDWL